MSDSMPVRNPRTGEFDYALSPTPTANIKDLATQLRHAQPGWQDAGLDARIDTLQRFKDALENHREAIVSALSMDTGRFAIARQELDGLKRSIDRWCQDAPGMLGDEERTSATLPHIAIQQRHEPYGLVGVISPWNFPLLLSFIDVTPALLAGCTAIDQTQRGNAAIRGARCRCDRAGPGAATGAAIHRRRRTHRCRADRAG